MLQFRRARPVPFFEDLSDRNAMEVSAGMARYRLEVLRGQSQSFQSQPFHDLLQVDDRWWGTAG